MAWSTYDTFYEGGLFVYDEDTRLVWVSYSDVISKFSGITMGNLKDSFYKSMMIRWKNKTHREENFFSIGKRVEKIKTPVIRQIILWKDIGKNVIL